MYKSRLILKNLITVYSTISKKLYYSFQCLVKKLKTHTFAVLLKIGRDPNLKNVTRWQ
jgi:hypothetical protein